MRHLLIAVLLAACSSSTDAAPGEGAALCNAWHPRIVAYCRDCWHGAGCEDTFACEHRSPRMTLGEFESKCASFWRDHTATCDLPADDLCAEPF